MKSLIVLLICSFATAHLLADDFKLSDGREYKDVTVSRTEPDGLVVVTDNGIEKLPFELLPKDVQQKYNYDPKKAAAYAQANAAAQHSLYQQNQQELKNQSEQAKEQAKELQEKSDAAAAAAASATPAPGSVGTLDMPAYSNVRVVGKVLQKIDEGLLVDCDRIGTKKAGDDPMIILLKSYPGYANAVDGDKINVAASIGGTFQYDIVNGTSSTVRVYLFQQQ